MFFALIYQIQVSKTSFSNVTLKQVLDETVACILLPKVS
jgi:hypothetical protein